jgi:DNA-binding transcriptional MerR regulator
MSGEGIKKLYYSISEVSELTGLDQHVLRYWETEFGQLRPKKNRAGRRVYTDSDIRMVLEIQRLLREEKFTIEGARQVLDAGGRSVDSERALRAELVQLRSFLVRILDVL